MIIKSLSGHDRRGSAIETDSDCGNCSGARCEDCMALFSYCGLEVAVGWHTSKEDAVAAGEAVVAKIAELVPGIEKLSMSSISYYLVDGQLVANHYKSGVGDIQTVCNSKAELYKEILERVEHQQCI